MKSFYLDKRHGQKYICYVQKFSIFCITMGSSSIFSMKVFPRRGVGHRDKTKLEKQHRCSRTLFIRYIVFAAVEYFLQLPFLLSKNIHT